MNFKSLFCHVIAGMSWMSNPVLGVCWTVAGLHESGKRKQIIDAQKDVFELLIKKGWNPEIK
jgi:hypothetical protein